MMRFLPILSLLSLLWVTAAPAGAAPVLQLGHAAEVSAVAGSVDGRLVATGDASGSVKIWEAESGLLLADLPGRGAAIAGLEFSAEGDRLAAWDGQAPPLLWETIGWTQPEAVHAESWSSEPPAQDSARSYAPAAALLEELTIDTAVPVAVSEEGSWLALAAGRGADLWDLRTGRSSTQLRGVTEPLAHLTWREDALVTVRTDGTIRSWDLGAGHPGKAVPMRAQVLADLAWSPAADQLASASPADGAWLRDASTGLPLHRFLGHAGAVRGVSWSPTGRRLASAGDDGRVLIWSALEGRLDLSLAGHPGGVEAVAWSLDASRLATGGRDGSARIWDLRTGEVLCDLPGHVGAVHAVAWSPDGKQLVTGAADGTLRIWNTKDGGEPSALEGATGAIRTLSWSADGTWIAAASAQGGLQLWALGAEPALSRLAPPSSPANVLAWSPRGQLLASGQADGTLIVYDAATMQARYEIQACQGAISALSWSPEGDQLLSASADGQLRLWKARKGKAGKQVLALDQPITAACWGPDGQQIGLGSADGSVRVVGLSMRSAQTLLEGHAGAVQAVAWHPTEALIATGGAEGALRAWHAHERNLVWHQPGPSALRSLAFSPDGGVLAAGYASGTLTLRQADSGAAIATLTSSASVEALSFAPDGKRLAAGAKGVILWDVHGKLKLGSLEGLAGQASALAWSPDGERLAVGTASGDLRLWNPPDGAGALALSGHTGPLRALAWSPDGSLLASAGMDQALRIWNAASGELLVTLLATRDGGFAVVDSHGRFDMDGDGAQALIWIVGDDIIGTRQLANRYYEPALLAKHLGKSPEPLTEVRPLKSLALFPAVEIQEPKSENAPLRIVLTNRGGGIGDVLVKLNGSDITARLERSSSDPHVQQLVMQADVSSLPYYRPGADNQVEVKAYNAEGYLASRGRLGSFASRHRAPPEPPQFWAVVVGTHDYRGDELDLRFPAKDAQAMHKALSAASANLFGEERTHLQLLSTAEDGSRPSRESIAAAFERTAQASPNDVLLVYLAGHGVNWGRGKQADYFYPMPELGSLEELDDTQLRKERALSGAELQALLLKSPAGKRVLILDTCHSGQLLETLSSTRAATSSQRRALERMTDRTGTFVLAGAAADAVSYETTRYGQGMLTYALLEGMRGAALQGDAVDVASLFQHARERVPQLAEGIGGIQKPVLEEPAAGSFDIGLLDVDSRAEIPLAVERPVLVRTTFFQVGEVLSDSISLSSATNTMLRDFSYQEEPPMVYFDVEDYPDAYRLSGQYLMGAKTTRLTATLALGEDIVAGFVLESEGIDDAALLARPMIFAVSLWFTEGEDAEALFGSHVGPVQVLSPEDIVSAAEELSSGEEQILPRWLRWLIRRGPCSEVMDRTDLSIALGTARLSFNRGSYVRFEEAVREIEQTLSCMSEPLTAEDIEALHRIQGLRLWLDGGKQAALPYLAMSHPSQSEFGIAEAKESENEGGDADEYSVLASSHAALLMFRTEYGGALAPSGRGRLTVNGQSTRREIPENVPFVLQRTSSRRVLGTHYVHPGDPIPAYPKLRQRLLWTGLGSAAVSAGLLYGAIHTRDQLLDESTYRPEQEQQDLLFKNHAFILSGAGMGAVTGISLSMLGLSFLW